jgi:ribosomal-protein-alanine N-acetyltransferase
VILTIRAGTPSDLARVHAIQTASPQASSWRPEEYLLYDLSVAESEQGVQGFLAVRSVAGDEWEILNIAVAPQSRRRGVARALLEPFLKKVSGAIFLEVRESNGVARELYKSLGFQELATRRDYYEMPSEAAVVMKYHSC